MRLNNNKHAGNNNNQYVIERERERVLYCLIELKYKNSYFNTKFIKKYAILIKKKN